MCGITGFIQRGTVRDPEEIARKMADRVDHRGPDGWGTWSRETGEGVVAFGHRRLSILDLREAAAQPMTSANGRWTICFNGEIYNYRRLTDRLPEGLELSTTSDTEVLLELIAHLGVRATLPLLNGMFAFAAWDAEAEELWLARDRIGIKPLYWTRQGDVFAFASQLKSLRPHPGIRLETSVEGLADFLRHGYIRAPRSIFEGVRALRPGHVARVRAGEVDVDCWWDIREVALQGLANPYTNVEEMLEELREGVDDAVRLRMIADVPLGAFLSGGTDSSLVVATMQSLSDRPVKTFSIGFDEQEFNEAPAAKAIARHLGTDHTELYVSPRDAMELIPQMWQWYDEPFADPSQLPTYIVSKLAREQVTVSLSGDGGDEFFLGYERYFKVDRLAEVMDSVPRGARSPVASGIRGLLAVMPDRVWESMPGTTGITTRRRAGSLADVLKMRDSVEFYRWLQSVARDPDELLLDRAPAREPLPLPLDQMPDFRKKAQLIDQWSYLHDDILTKVDRASMAVSLEARVPLLDHRIMALSWRVPSEINERHPEGKWPLRKLLWRDVPRELLDRPKQGFGVPISTWFKGDLRDWAGDLLSPDSVRNAGLLDPVGVSKIWSEHLDGTVDRGGLVWAIVNYLAWKRGFDSAQ